MPKFLFWNGSCFFVTLTLNFYQYQRSTYNFKKQEFNASCLPTQNNFVVVTSKFDARKWHIILLSKRCLKLWTQQNKGKGELHDSPQVKVLPRLRVNLPQAYSPKSFCQYRIYPCDDVNSFEWCYLRLVYIAHDPHNSTTFTLIFFHRCMIWLGMFILCTDRSVTYHCNIIEWEF